MLINLTWITAGALHAGTFDPASIAPESGIDVLNRGFARQQVGRTLFADPYATVTIGNVDIYDVAPYLEARRFQIVSDPRWNRLVFGEVGRSLHAYDGKGDTFGALSDPRGMATDESNRLYLADAGNNRVLVFDAVTEFGDIRLVPRFAIDGLARPHGVAFSDGGTPFVPGDDVLYVADTGGNRVVAYALEAGGARQISAIGALGSGPGHFAGPMAVTVGRTDGKNTRDVYVADAHTRRIVRLTLSNGALIWAGDRSHDADIVTALDTDHWGNIYAAAPNRGVIRKYNSDLTEVADIHQALQRPRQFHVPFVSIRDHRDGRQTRMGQSQGLLVEQWSDQSGIRLWNLGIEIGGLTVEGGDMPEARFAITDRARMTIEVSDPASGAIVSRRTTDPLSAGAHAIAITPEDLAGAGSSDLLVRLTAASAYPNGPSAVSTAAFVWNGKGAVILPARPMLLGNTPNPFVPATRIAFMLPAGDHRDAKLRVFDAQGRAVRHFDRAFVPGRNEVVWDGSNDQGASLPAGIYFYRLDVMAEALTHKMVLVR
jgi:hypothetical protein